jgi:hypothetical protein
MPVTTFRNLPVSLNNNILFAESVIYTTKASIEPKFYRTDNQSTSYFTNNYLENSISITYPITGADFIKNYISNPSGSISGNLAGMYFKTGYLKSYSFSLEPNQPLYANCEIVFYSSLTGLFTPTTSNSLTPFRIFDASNVRINNLTGFNNNDNINSINYTYDCEISPQIKSQSTVPNEIRVGRQVTNCSISTDSASGNMPYSGQKISFNIDVVNEASTTVNRYNIDRYIFSKELSISNDSSLSSKFDIVQYITDLNALSTGYFPTSGHYFSNVRISGQNLSNVSYVNFADLSVGSFTLNSSQLITVKVPPGALSGALSLVTFSNQIINVGQFRVLDSGIVVNSFTPRSGSYYT